MDNLVPAIIQSAIDNSVLMLGYMSKESLTKTLEIGKVTFYSRSKRRLWTKGEESGNFLELKDIEEGGDTPAKQCVQEPGFADSYVLALS